MTGSSERRRPAGEPLDARAGRFVSWLRLEPSAGKLLLAATAVALLWANLDEGSYRSFWDIETAIGPNGLHLDLTFANWAADGLLAIFFFLAGMEVKRELVAGQLARRRAAALPIVAAVGGMIGPTIGSC
jgi:NhaA family Na+:H+ antiporter